MKKKIILLIGVLFLTVSTFAQSPEKMSYQSLIRNSADVVLSNEVVNMKISILQSSADGVILYEETQTTQTNINGLVSIEIGSGLADSFSFSSIDWSLDTSYYIKIETDIDDDLSYDISTVSQLLSVPYALYAKTSGSSTPGPQGADGIKGDTGVQGLTGAAGPTGDQGIQGATGSVGAAGADGNDGDNGAQGVQGPTGSAGANGTDGTNGETGAAGADGSNGSDGAKGDTGSAGADGSNGSDGAKGDTGSAGVDGSDGAKGDTGSAGSDGAKGDTGSVGADGSNGAKGDIGETGPAGSNGTNGTAGATGPAGADGNDGAIGADGNDGTTGSTPDGTQVGQMNYWNGIIWKTINPGTSGAVLQLVGTTPTWVSDPDIIAPVITVTPGTDTVERLSTWTDAGATADTGETVTVSGTVDTSTAGTYTITYSATDAAGTVGTATRTVTVVDTTAPVITVTSGTDTVAQNATWTDAGATADGDETVTVSGTVDTSHGGAYIITYTATDASGNPATPVTRTVTVNALARNDAYDIAINADGVLLNSTVGAVGGVFDWYNNGVAANSSSNTISGFLRTVRNTPTHRMSYGGVPGRLDQTSGLTTNNYNYNGIPGSGNDSSAAGVVLRYTATEEKTILISTVGAYNDAVVVIFTEAHLMGQTQPFRVVTQDSGDATTFEVTFPYFGDANVNQNIYYIALTSYNSSNLNSNVSLNITTEDTIAPVVTVTSGTDTVEQGATWTDAGATADSGETVTASGAVDTSTIGSYTITYTATDASGNVGTAIRTVTVNPDTTAPVITVISGTDTVEQGSTWTDAGATADTGETVTVSGSVDENTAGTYTITYTATDASGNVGTATRAVTVVDTTAPVITSGFIGTNLVENSGANQTIYTITDTEGVTSYSIAGVDAVLLSVNSSNGNVTLTANPDYETKNSYSFTATATDASGNVSAATTVTFSITDIEKELGAFYQGGTIFYLDGAGGGLIVADVNISGEFYWSNSSSGFGTYATFGKGQLNTTRIVDNDSYIYFSGSNAAREANNYSIEIDGVTYSDWFLPSKDEAAVMHSSGVVTTFKPAGNWMWTSTGYPPFNAYDMDQNGNIGHSNRQQKGYMYVKPVRNF